MKLRFTSKQSYGESDGHRGISESSALLRTLAAFTLIEIAISLAIIGFALVAIIGVLPTGLNVQKDNRHETIINQDVNVFMEALRSGARGFDDLTQYVNAIVISATNSASGNSTSIFINPAYPPTYPVLPGLSRQNYLTRGSNIVGLLGTPRIVFTNGVFWTNRVVAYVRAFSGAATEKFPQSDPSVLDLAFSYRMTVEISPLALADYSLANQCLSTNLHEIRLLFRWPILPSGEAGNGRQIFRTMVSGREFVLDDAGLAHYFFEPRTFVPAQ